MVRASCRSSWTSWASTSWSLAVSGSIEEAPGEEAWAFASSLELLPPDCASEVPTMAWKDVVRVKARERGKGRGIEMKQGGGPNKSAI